MVAKLEHLDASRRLTQSVKSNHCVSQKAAYKKVVTGPLPQKNIEYEWSNFNVSLVMDDPFIQPWNDVSNKAWMDLTEGGNSESFILQCCPFTSSCASYGGLCD